jgi:tRNA dimethylallyltransferase
MSNVLPVIVIAGPTASGKSAAALAAAQAFGGVVINADSMQIYRGLRVLTAAPDATAMARVPHLLYGVLDPAERCSAGRWLELAQDAIRQSRASGRLPIVVGGTGLYLSALLRGLAPVAPVPPEIEAAAEGLLVELGADAFRQRLYQVDPAAAARIEDPARLVRAYAVYQATGRALSAWQADHVPAPAVPGPIGGLALVPPRAVLYAAIDRRFERMFDEGALDEVRSLAARGLDPRLPAMKALGVAELLAFVRGEIDRDAACRLAQAKSRRYAKRQLTWLRHQLGELEAWNEQYSESLNEKIFSFIRQFVLTGPH